MEQVVGILGGMGPQATVDLMTKIIALTPAKTEKDHVRMLVDCNPKVADRVAAIRGEGQDPTPELVAMARGLVSQGAGLLAIACNTAHYFYPAIAASVPVPVLNLMELTAERVAARRPGVRAVGLLATGSTIKTGLYHRQFEALGITVITPDEADIPRFMSLVTGVKVGKDGPEARAAMAAMARELLERGAELVIAGCTEVPLLLTDGPGMPVLDPTTVLAERIVQIVTGRAG